MREMDTSEATRKLHRALDESDAPALKEAVEQGADLEAESSSRMSPLFIAVYRDLTECAGILIEARADLSRKDMWGSGLVHISAWNGNASLTLELLKAGADRHALDGFGRSTLIQAARKGHSEVVRILLKAGVDQASEDVNGWTALTWAASIGAEECIKELLNKDGAPLAAEVAEDSGHVGLAEYISGWIRAADEERSLTECSGLGSQPRDSKKTKRL